LFGLVPALIEGDSPVVPILIKLNDLQHIKDPDEIYKAIIIKVIEGFVKAYKHIQSSERMAYIHQGIQSLPNSYTESEKLPELFNKLVKMTSGDYKEIIKSNFGSTGGAAYGFVEASVRYEKEHVTEIRSKGNAGITDIKDAYEVLLESRNGKILLLLDEAGSLPRSFFLEPGGVSLFETLMNQFRTSGFIRTKIAIYPNTVADMLFETRYGDLVELSENVVDDLGYGQFRAKALNLIERYVSRAANDLIRPHQIFDIRSPSLDVDDALEQVLYASGGNMRRLVQILDQSMLSAFSDHEGNGRVSAKHVTEALKRQSHSAESIYSPGDIQFLSDVAKVCRNRNTYKFQFPYKSPVLAKYTSKSEESNLLNVIEAGTGKKKTTYAFDYSYCVNHDIPTHNIAGTERIDKGRSRNGGTWISRTAQISEELVNHAKLLNKIRGEIRHVATKSGFIIGDDEKEYWFLFQDVMADGENQVFVPGKKVMFYPSEFDGTLRAAAVEIL
jgi:hypothetical protein